MLIRLNSLDELAVEKGPLHLALGVFDGVHLGHQAVIESAVYAARDSGGKAFVVTFSPHPIRVIAPSRAPTSLLATLDEKGEVVEALGVDGLVVIKFDQEFAKIEAIDFVRKICAGDVRSISVGADWRFGRERAGGVDVLMRMGVDLGFKLEVIEAVKCDGERISSTRVRQAIRDGNFDAVERMLGRPYYVSGTVIEGRKLGRNLGFPTANLRLGELQAPKDGVWAVRVNGEYDGIANLGMRPTVGGDERLLEVHLFDFSGDLYGKSLRVAFVGFVRDERKFSTLEDLQEQIRQDVLNVRQRLS